MVPNIVIEARRPVADPWTARHTFAKDQTAIVANRATNREQLILAPHMAVPKLVRHKGANPTTVNAENTVQKLEGHVVHRFHATAVAIVVVTVENLAVNIPNKNVEALSRATAEVEDVLVVGLGLAEKSAGEHLLVPAEVNLFVA